MDDTKFTRSGLCKYSMQLLRDLYHVNFGECLANVTLSLDAFRANPSVDNFIPLKRHFEEMTIAYEKMRVFEVHGK